MSLALDFTRSASSGSRVIIAFTIAPSISNPIFSAAYGVDRDAYPGFDTIQIDADAPKEKALALFANC